MKLIKFLLIISTAPCFSEVFYYGDHFLTVDLRSDQSSLLKFEKAPLSSSCQPGVLRFEPIEQNSVSVTEKEHLQESSSNEKDATTSLLIRVTPQEKSGLVSCSFTLAGGDEVPIRFNLTENIARPYLDFKPIIEKFHTPQISNDLGLLASLIKGDSIYLHDVTNDFDSCSSHNDRSRSCKHRTHETEFADYKIIYVGTDTNLSAWSLTLKLKKDLQFSDISDLNATQSNNIYYSAITPQKAKYTKGELLKHHILTSSQVTHTELLEVLP